MTVITNIKTAASVVVSGTASVVVVWAGALSLLHVVCYIEASAEAGSRLTLSEYQQYRQSVEESIDFYHEFY